MLNLFTFIAAEATTTDAAAAMQQSSMYSMVFMIIIIAAFWLILIRPQRKKEKADAEMRKNVHVGDTIVTAGGIVGFIVKVEEDTVVIETGGDRDKLRIRRWAISENISAKEEVKAQEAAKKIEKDDVSPEK